MISFTKQTTPADEMNIETLASRMHRKGFAGDTIVYRNSVDAALATVALYTVKGPGLISALGENGRYIVIVTQDYETGQKIREQVNKLRNLVAPEFGVTPDDPKEAAVTPARHQPLRP